MGAYWLAACALGHLARINGFHPSPGRVASPDRPNSRVSSSSATTCSAPRRAGAPKTGILCYSPLADLDREGLLRVQIGVLGPLAWPCLAARLELAMHGVGVHGYPLPPTQLLPSREVWGSSPPTRGEAQGEDSCPPLPPRIPFQGQPSPCHVQMQGGGSRTVTGGKEKFCLGLAYRTHPQCSCLFSRAFVRGLATRVAAVTC